jgi:hypothetical protein
MSLAPLRIKTYRGINMTSKEAVMPKKAKTTVYMTEEEETLLNELFIKRLRERNKTDKSALLCEGIRLLYAQEIERSNDKK